MLSPEFSPERTKYIIWLPYETDNLTVMGLTQDSAATVRTEGGRNLIAGADNEIRVICTAENGEEKVYTIIAKRAPAHEDLPSQPDVQQPTTQPTTMPTTRPTTPSNHVCPPSNETPLAMIIIPWIVAVVAVGALLVMLITDTKKNK